MDPPNVSRSNKRQRIEPPRNNFTGNDTFGFPDHLGSYFTKQQLSRDCALVLANKVISDLNTLVQYLESTDPALLKASQLSTAHYFVTSFIAALLQQKQPMVQQTGSNLLAVTNSIGLPSYQTLPSLQPFYSFQPVNTSVMAPTLLSNNHLSMFQPFNHNQTRRNTPETIDFTKVTLDDFDMLEILGTGTFGKVRLCKHKQTKKYFCIKILNKARILRLKQAEHIKNEKNVLNSVSHPFIVKLYSTFKDKVNLYLLMEFIPGGELFNYIRRAGRLPDRVSKLYAAEIVLAIEHLHKHNILYRDLKPENLLLDESGHIKLTDFGFSKYVPHRTFSMCGTPEYIAPEIILSKGHDKAVDWWSLGILIYEMLAGYPPFNDEPNKTIFEKILSERVDIPDYFNPQAKDLIDRLLVVDSSKRLGCMKGEVDDIKGHPWFSGINWIELIHRKEQGPLNPGVSKDGDTHNFYKYSDVDIHEDFDVNVDYDEIFKDF